MLSINRRRHLSCCIRIFFWKLDYNTTIASVSWSVINRRFPCMGGYSTHSHAKGPRPARERQITTAHWFHTTEQQLPSWRRCGSPHSAIVSPYSSNSFGRNLEESSHAPLCRISLVFCLCLRVPSHARNRFFHPQVKFQPSSFLSSDFWLYLQQLRSSQCFSLNTLKLPVARSQSRSSSRNKGVKIWRRRKQRRRNDGDEKS